MRGKSILVVTCLDEKKTKGIEAYLKGRGTTMVQFISVSGSKAMFDKIDLGGLQGKVDVVLIGAGVGAVSILEQVRPLEAIAIDCGFVLDVMAYPENKWNRQFCVSDMEFDPSRIRFFAMEDIEQFRAENAKAGKSNEALEELVRLRNGQSA
jgi:hypothetical protein